MDCETSGTSIAGSREIREIRRSSNYGRGPDRPDVQFLFETRIADDSSDSNSDSEIIVVEQEKSLCLPSPSIAASELSQMQMRMRILESNLVKVREQNIHLQQRIRDTSPPEVNSVAVATDSQPETNLVDVATATDSLPQTNLVDVATATNSLPEVNSVDMDTDSPSCSSISLEEFVELEQRSTLLKHSLQTQRSHSAKLTNKLLEAQLKNLQCEAEINRIREERDNLLLERDAQFTLNCIVNTVCDWQHISVLDYTSEDLLQKAIGSRGNDSLRVELQKAREDVKRLRDECASAIQLRISAEAELLSARKEILILEKHCVEKDLVVKVQEPAGRNANPCPPQNTPRSIPVIGGPPQFVPCESEGLVRQTPPPPCGLPPQPCSFTPSPCSLPSISSPVFGSLQTDNKMNVSSLASDDLATLIDDNQVLQARIDCLEKSLLFWRTTARTVKSVLEGVSESSMVSLSQFVSLCVSRQEEVEDQDLMSEIVRVRGVGEMWHKEYERVLKRARELEAEVKGKNSLLEEMREVSQADQNRAEQLTVDLSKLREHVANVKLTNAKRCIELNQIAVEKNRAAETLKVTHAAELQKLAGESMLQKTALTKQIDEYKKLYEAECAKINTQKNELNSFNTKLQGKENELTKMKEADKKIRVQLADLTKVLEKRKNEIDKLQKEKIADMAKIQNQKKALSEINLKLKAKGNGNGVGRERDLPKDNLLLEQLKQSDKKESTQLKELQAISDEQKRELERMREEKKTGVKMCASCDENREKLFLLTSENETYRESINAFAQRAAEGDSAKNMYEILRTQMNVEEAHRRMLDSMQEQASMRIENIRLREQIQVLSGDATRSKCAHTLRALKTQFDVINLLKKSCEDVKGEMGKIGVHLSGRAGNPNKQNPSKKRKLN